MATTNTKDPSIWKDGFLFVGNHPALDFLNTRPVQNGEAVELLPDFTAILRWFRTRGVLSRRQEATLERQWGQSARAGRTVEAIRGFRERLREAVIQWEEGHSLHRPMINEINRLLAAYPMSTRLDRNGKGLSTELYFQPQSPEEFFAPLAQAAAMLFVDADRHRMRKCSRCVLHFVDTSKKGARRWCSMRLCGNRLKVAAYAARQR